MARPKSPTAILYERKVRKLEEEIEALKAQLAVKPQLDAAELIKEADLPLNGFGILETKKGEIRLVNIRFNLETKQGLVLETKKIADNVIRGDYELKKLIAHRTIINKVEE